MSNYIEWIRGQVGHDQIFLNFSGACIRNDEGKILLQKRAASKNMWGFPGGALEMGESAEEAAIRKVREETGLCIHADSLIGVYTKYSDEYPVVQVPQIREAPETYRSGLMAFLRGNSDALERLAGRKDEPNRTSTTQTP